METKRIFRGWFIVAACMLMITGNSLLSTGMSINLAALRTVAGLTATQTSMVLTLRGVSSFLVMFFADKYYEKLGLKRGMVIALLMAAATFLIFAVGNGNVYIYYLAGIVGGVPYAYGLILPASMLLRRWFNKSRAFALSIASAGTAFTSIIGAPILQSLVNNHGLLPTFLAEAAFLIACAVILLLVIKNSPEEVGLEPYGGKDYVEAGKKTVRQDRSVGLSQTWVWIVFVALLLMSFGASPAAAHASLNFTTVGLDSMVVATGISVYGFGVLIFKLIYGKVVDKVGSCMGTVIFGLLVATGYAMYGAAVWFPNNTFMFAAMIILSAGIPIHTLGYPMWAMDMVSEKEYTKTLKRFQMAYQLAGLIGSPLPGLIADATGSYSLFYLIFAASVALSVVIVVCAYAALKKKRALAK